MERQSNGGDLRSQPHEEDISIGYEDHRVVETCEVLEQRFLDNIIKLNKEQIDTEEAKIVRHNEVCSDYFKLM